MKDIFDNEFDAEDAFFTRLASVGHKPFDNVDWHMTSALNEGRGSSRGDIARIRHQIKKYVGEAEREGLARDLHPFNFEKMPYDYIFMGNGAYSQYQCDKAHEALDEIFLIMSGLQQGVSKESEEYAEGYQRMEFLMKNIARCCGVFPDSILSRSMHPNNDLAKEDK